MSKKVLSDLIKKSKDIETDILYDDGIKWEVKSKGVYKDMSKKQSFEQIVLEFIKEQRSFNKKVDTRLDKVDTRLDNLEKDVKQLKTDVNQLKTDVNQLKTDVNQLKIVVKKIENTPTVNKELKLVN